MRTLLPAVLIAVLTPCVVYSQGPVNLVANPTAEFGSFGWRVDGEAAADEFDGNRCFILRNGARLTQAVKLPAGSAGKFALFIAHTIGDRTDRPDDITDRPYLNGLTLSADGRRILLHNQAPTMGSLAIPPGQWGKSWGVFEIPKGASSIIYQLAQGSRRGTARDGSAARFDDVGLFVFDTRQAAVAFVRRYR